MHITLLAAAASLLCNLGLAIPANGYEGHVVHEKRDAEEHPEEWEKRSRAHNLQVLPMRIALKQRNLEHAERYIMDVSNPSSPNFGKHWTAEEVANVFMPTEETSQRVTEWLENSGIHPTRISRSKGHNWLEFDATVEEAEELLGTEYHVYKHTPSGNHQAACDHYHVPHDLRDHIDFIMPTIQLDGMQPLRKRAMEPSNETGPLGRVAVAKAKAPPMSGLTGLKYCGQLITIECLRAIYGFPKGSTKMKGNVLGIAEWADYLYKPDLEKYFYNFTDPVIPQGTFPEFISIDGGKHSNLTVAKKQEVVESALDFQTAYSIVYPQNIRLYQVGDSVNVNSVGTFNIFLDALDASYCTYKGGDSKKYDPHYPDKKKGGYKGPLQCGGAPLSSVFSFSYLQTEASLSKRYQHRQCHEWMKLGLQGVSVLFASGDSGVEMRYNAGFPNKCLAAHSNKMSTKGPRFNPGFPVNCPYVTAVGATDLLNSSIYGGERAVRSIDKKNPDMNFFSGGGFSNYFTLPDYQATAVTNYLDNYAPNYGPNVYNRSGNARAYPDVSSLGLNLATVYLGKVFGIGGTSASAPTVASIVTLLNEKRIEAGKGPIGFLNPVFYANPDAFNDITVGGNPGCGTQGFRCAPGWDPITGLGSPNYPKLEKVFLDLP